MISFFSGRTISASDGQIISALDGQVMIPLSRTEDIPPYLLLGKKGRRAPATEEMGMVCK